MKKRDFVAGILSFSLLFSSIVMLSPNVEANQNSGMNRELQQAGIIVHQTVKGGHNDERLPDLFFSKNNLITDLKTPVVKVYPEKKRQTFLGVGGAMTEAAAYNIKKMTEEDQKFVYDAYFSQEGANYSLLRSSIGSADFHTRSYSYADTLEPDPELKSFSIEKDWEYIIPAIHRVQTYRPDIKFFAAPWAPPAWMKKSGVRRGQTGTAALSFIDNSLKKEYYESYANYFVKYMQAYEAAGIPVFSLSLQNEAQNNPKWEACTWSSEDTATFIGDYLGPALERNNLDPELLIWDWDKGNDLMHGEGFIKYNTRVLSNPKARKYIDGIAFHWYAGDIWHELKGVPMWSRDFYSLDEVSKKFPDISLYATEACQEKGPWWGSFDPADRYIFDILNDFEHGVKSWIDWNLVLDETGGPTQGVINQCHAPIMIDSFNRPHLQPSYYILKRISKEIQPGKRSIETYSKDADIVKTAAIDDEGRVSVLLGNVTDSSKQITIVEDEHFVNVTLPPHSLTTLNYDSKNKPVKEDTVQPLFASWQHPIKAEASSFEKNPFKNYRPSQAIDTAKRTRWASDWKDREHITFELNRKSIIDGISLHFENGQNSAFEILVSNDGKNFTKVLVVNQNQYKAKILELGFNEVEAKYVRFQGVKRGNKYGYSIYDAKVHILR